MKSAVIKTGGKQYIVTQNQEIIIDKLTGDKGAKIDFETLALMDTEKTTIQLGTPILKKSVSGEIVENIKGDKIRVARFKAKSRYRKVRGFRAELSRVRIVSL